MSEKIEPHIVVYKDRSVLFTEDGKQEVFLEGKQSKEASERYKAITKALSDGFLENVIIESIKPDVTIQNLTDEQIASMTSLVDSINSENGRAIIGLTMMQLTLKSINPNQNIRLHKGSNNRSHFSWKEGLSMRVLDKAYITPVLRKYGLLKLNQFGFMMTRTLAENYPYTKLYKAKIKGAKKEWLDITDWIESGEIDPLNGLKQFIALLNNKTEEFEKISEKTLDAKNLYLKSSPTEQQTIDFILNYVEGSTYSARLFEVSMHSLCQAIDEMKALDGYLKPLSQMRSANKKHGNIGDVEITSDQEHREIIEGWDAKYGKTYMRDELEELHDKLSSHPETEIAGFVTDIAPDLTKEIVGRKDEIAEIHNVRVEIFSVKEWIDYQIESKELNKEELSQRWLTALAESICQKRRDQAPIDEPTLEWVKELHAALNKELS